MATHRYGMHSAPRSPSRRGWFYAVFAVLCVLGLVLTLAGLVRLVTDVLNAGGMVTEPDPMFSEAPENVTRPPSLTDDAGEGRDMAEDPSQYWHYENLTPLTEDGIAAE